MTGSVSNHALKALSSPQSFFSDQAKAYGDSNQTKSLGGANPALAGWLDEAKSYYNGVMSGEIAKPDPAAWNQFLGQMQWAQTQAYGAGGSNLDDPTMGPAAQPQINEFGGELGPDGNWNYDLVSTKLPFTGKDTRNDIFGTDNQINLGEPSAQVSCEETSDHGVPVLKVIVTTSKGTAAYYYENYTDPSFKLNISAPNLDNIKGEESFSGKIEAKKYDPTKTDKPEAPQSSVPGDAVEGQPHTYSYEVDSVDQTLDFHPQTGKDNEYHWVVGNSTLSVPVSSSVNVIKETFVGPDGSNYDYKVEVKHKDGKTDTYFGKKEFNCHINAVPEYISWDMNANGVKDTVETGKIPDELKDIFTISGGDADATDGSAGAQAILDNLMKETGSNETVFLSELKNAGFAYTDIKDVLKDIEDKKFPPSPSKHEDFVKFVHFLAVMDDDLYQAYQDWKKAAKGSTAEEQKKAQTAFMGRLMELLGTAYPDTKVRGKDFDPSTPWSVFFTQEGKNFNLKIFNDGRLELADA